MLEESRIDQLELPEADKADGRLSLKLEIMLKAFGEKRIFANDTMLLHGYWVEK